MATAPLPERAAELDPEKLSTIYARQAPWFAGERNRLLRKIDIAAKRSVLDLGTGTGEMLGELGRRSVGRAFGVDADLAALRLARGPRTAACATALPFPNSTFDLVFAQMFFLWARPLDAVVREIKRVLVPGGHLLAAAEPDYGGAIEYPEEGAHLTALAEALSDEGADVHVARKLGPALTAAGFRTACGLHPARPLEAPSINVHKMAASHEPQGPPPEFLFLPYFHFLAENRAPR